MAGQEDQYRKARAEKAQRLIDLGVDPNGVVFEPTHTIAEARAMAADFIPDAEEQPRAEGTVKLAGRIGNIRKAGGKLMFMTLFDRSRARFISRARISRR